MKNTDRYKKMEQRAWEEGCYSRASCYWGELLCGYRARALGVKIAALESLIHQLKAWKELLEMGVGK